MSRQPARGEAVQTLSNSQVVTEDEVHEAMESLRSSIRAIGVARGKMVMTEAMLRHVKSLEMVHSAEHAVSAQERDAYSSDRYRQAIERYQEATTEFESLRAERETSLMVCEMWRSQRASERAATRI